jgi:GNAT superfamily N-acetyltransferase
MPGIDFSIRTARPIELPYAIEIDDAAFRLFADVGLFVVVPDDHPFVVAERERWRQAIERGALYFAEVDDEPVGFAALGTMDGHAELEQLAVLPEHGRRGIGRALIEHVCNVCHSQGESEVWLTTYAHVPWNGPFYERVGFEVVPEAECGAEHRATLAAQRELLLAPEQRVAMRRWL